VLDPLVLGRLFLFPAFLDDGLGPFDGLADLFEFFFRRLQPGLGPEALFAAGLGAFPEGQDLVPETGLVFLAAPGVGLELLDLGRRGFLPFRGRPHLVADAVHLFLDEVEAGLCFEEAALEAGGFGREGGQGRLLRFNPFLELPGFGLAER